MALALRRLVLNADDAGIDVPRNEGILLAHTAGVLRSATALTTAPAFADFVDRARGAPRLGVGVHLNLSECCPPATPRGVPGAFVDKERLWARAEAGALDTADIAAEFAAQLERALAAGLRPTHVDGHNHVHVFPCVAAALDRLEARFPFVARRRVPREFEGAPHPSAKGAWFRERCAVASRAAPLFAGFALEGACTLERLVATCAACPGDTLEVMLHPGCCDAGSVKYSADAARERELATLLDPRLAEWLAREGVESTHYGELDLAVA